MWRAAISRASGGPAAARLAALITAVGLAAVPVAGRAMEATAGVQRAATSIYDRPGRLVRIPDRRHINLRCAGQGAPTVLFESGFGATSEAWTKVQPAVARVTRACAYDRAGYGFSDPGPLPRDGAAIARDLDRALRSGGVPGPYVLVGHSAGGLYVRLFAGRRLRDVVGVVLVDPSVEHQEQRFAAAFGPEAGSLDPLRRRVANCLEQATGTRAAVIASPECALGRGLYRHGGADAWRTQGSELDTLFTTTSDEVDRLGGLLKDVPVIVLTASRAAPSPATQDPGVAMWQAMHQELAGRFRHGEQRTIQSSHLMMIERPEVVTKAILELVAVNRAATAKASRSNP
jgi:pimeloyl-ACP methyl ester carboxylesterase